MSKKTPDTVNEFRRNGTSGRKTRLFDGQIYTPGTPEAN
jgi:hypothetical protein